MNRPLTPSEKRKQNHRDDENKKADRQLQESMTKAAGDVRDAHETIRREGVRIALEAGYGEHAKWLEEDKSPALSELLQFWSLLNKERQLDSNNWAHVLDGLVKNHDNLEYVCTQIKHVGAEIVKCSEELKQESQEVLNYTQSQSEESQQKFPTFSQFPSISYFDGFDRESRFITGLTDRMSRCRILAKATTERWINSVKAEGRQGWNVTGWASLPNTRAIVEGDVSLAMSTLRSFEIEASLLHGAWVRTRLGKSIMETNEAMRLLNARGRAG
jgi:hypothetical protein